MKVWDISSNFSVHNIDVMFHFQLQLEASKIPPISRFGQLFMLKLKEFSSFLVSKVVEETLSFRTVKNQLPTILRSKVMPHNVI